MFAVATTYVYKITCYKGFQATQMSLNKGHGIEASYITVHLYDILVTIYVFIFVDVNFCGFHDHLVISKNNFFVNP